MKSVTTIVLGLLIMSFRVQAEAAAEDSFCGKVVQIRAVYADRHFVSSVSLYDADKVDVSATSYNDKYLTIREGLVTRLESSLREDLLKLHEKWFNNIADADIVVCLENLDSYTRRYDGKFYRYSKSAMGLSVKVKGEEIKIDERLEVNLPSGGWEIAVAIANQWQEKISNKCVYGEVSDSGSSIYMIPFGSEGFECGDEHFGIRLNFGVDGEFESSTLVDI